MKSSSPPIQRTTDTRTVGRAIAATRPAGISRRWQNGSRNRAWRRWSRGSAPVRLQSYLGRSRWQRGWLSPGLCAIARPASPRGALGLNSASENGFNLAPVHCSHVGQGFSLRRAAQIASRIADPSLKRCASTGRRPEQHRQLCDISRDPPRLIARKQFGGGASSGLRLEIHVSQCPPVVVADDETTAVVFFDIPWRREAARRHRQSPARGRYPGAVSSPSRHALAVPILLRFALHGGAAGFLILSQ